MYWALIPAAIFGVVVLRRRRVRLLPLLALAASVTIGTAVTYGFTRFRAAAEVAIVLLAAVAVDAVLRRRARQRQAIAASEPCRSQRARRNQPRGSQRRSAPTSSAVGSGSSPTSDATREVPSARGACGGDAIARAARRRPEPR